MFHLPTIKALDYAIIDYEGVLNNNEYATYRSILIEVATHLKLHAMKSLLRFGLAHGGLILGGIVGAGIGVATEENPLTLIPFGVGTAFELIDMYEWSLSACLRIQAITPEPVSCDPENIPGIAGKVFQLDETIYNSYTAIARAREGL